MKFMLTELERNFESTMLKDWAHNKDIYSSNFF